MANAAEARIANPPGDVEHGSFVPTKPGDSEDGLPKDIKQFVPLKDYLNNIADHAVKLGNDERRRERRRKIAKMRSFYGGDMVLRWDGQSQQWINKKKAGDALYVDPVLATFIDIIVAQIAKSHSTLVVRARNDERVDKQQAAKYATEMLADISRTLIDPINTQLEIKYGFLLSGEAYRYTYWDRHAEGMGIDKPSNAVKIVKGSARGWYCPDCDAHGSGKVSESAEPITSEPNGDNDLGSVPAAEAIAGDEAQEDSPQRCPKCNYPQVETIGGRDFKVTLDTGNEYQQIGDAKAEFPDPLEMTVVGARTHISEALVVIRDRMLPRCILESVFKGKSLPSTGTPENLRIKERAERASDAGNGANDGTGAFEMLHFQEIWFHPAVYHDYKSPRDEKLPSGDMLKKGEALGPRADNGAYMARVGKTIVDLYEQATRDCWSHAPNSVTDHFHGAGEWDLLPQQEQKNELRSMQINGVMLESFRPLIKRAGYIKVDQLPNKAGAVVNVTNLPQTMRLDDVMSRVPGGGGTMPDAYTLDDKIAGGMQQRSGAFSSTTDLPDAKLLGTATGVATLAEHAVGRRAPMLALRAKMEVDQAYQYLQLRQDYWPEQMYASLDKKVGGDAGKWFRESSIRKDFIVEVVPESFMPQTAAQEHQNFNNLMQAMIPLSGGDPAVLKQLRKRAVDLYGRGTTLDTYQLEKVEAAVRLERVKQVAKYFEGTSQVLDPSGQPSAEAVAGVLAEVTLLLKMPHVSNTADNMINPDEQKPDMLQFVPVDALLDNHAEFVDIYTEWMKSSEGREATLFTRTCVRTLIEKHRDGDLQRVIADKTDANLAQIPDLQAQQVAAQAQAGTDAEIGADQHAQELQQTVATNDELAAQDAKHHLAGVALGINPPTSGQSK